MVMSNCYICSDDFIRYEGKPARRELDRALRGTHALSRLYRAKEGWVFLEAPTADDWDRLRRALDLPADPRFDTAEARARFGDQLVAELALVFAARPAGEWEADLRAAGVACVRADRADQEEFFLTDPAVEACGLRVHHEHHDGWSMWRQGPPVKTVEDAGPGRGRRAVRLRHRLRPPRSRLRRRRTALARRPRHRRLARQFAGHAPGLRPRRLLTPPQG